MRRRTLIKRDSLKTTFPKNIKVNKDKEEQQQQKHDTNRQFVLKGLNITRVKKNTHKTTIVL